MKLVPQNAPDLKKGVSYYIRQSTRERLTRTAKAAGQTENNFIGAVLPAFLDWWDSLPIEDRLKILSEAA